MTTPWHQPGFRIYGDLLADGDSLALEGEDLSVSQDKDASQSLSAERRGLQVDVGQDCHLSQIIRDCGGDYVYDEIHDAETQPASDVALAICDRDLPCI